MSTYMSGEGGAARRAAAYALLRVTVGVVLLLAGVGKFVSGVDGFASGLADRFGETWLPGGLVELAAHLLPFVEVALGVLLVVGLLSVPALFGAGVLMLILTFGTTVEGAHEAVGRNVVYALAFFGLLWLADRDRYSLERVVGRRRARAIGGEDSRSTTHSNTGGEDG